MIVVSLKHFRQDIWDERLMVLHGESGTSLSETISQYTNVSRTTRFWYSEEDLIENKLYMDGSELYIDRLLPDDYSPNYVTQVASTFITGLP